MRYAIVILGLLVLSACGGGSGGDGSPKPPEVVTMPPVSCPDGSTVPAGQTCPQLPMPPVVRLPFPLPNVECAARSLCEVSNQFVGETHYGVPDTQSAADVQQAPVYFGGGYFRVGVDQGNQHLGDLREVGKRGAFNMRHGSLNDGVGRATLSSYLTQGVGSAARRYESPPTVRVIGPANARDMSLVSSAVQLVNAALPMGARMQIGVPLPNFSLRDTVDGDGLFYDNEKVLTDTIQVEFVPAGEFYSDAGATTWNRVIVVDDLIAPGEHGHAVEASYIMFNKGANVYREVDDPFGREDSVEHRRPVILLAHEIIHALGVYRHPSPDFDTIMEGTGTIYNLTQGTQQQQPSSLLWPVDREALRVLYSRLGSDDSPSDFGPWSSTSTHVVGNGSQVHFGVALRNGYAEPWAYGHPPGQDLANNQSLSGNATWSGALLGFTPDGNPVAGDADIGVNLGNLTGHADFTALEQWAAGPAPGDAGTGATWGDGDLGYSIAVRGNTFKQTGGDTGTLTGIFTGRNHEGAAGTLERSDLTAAFGASRE